MMGSADDIKARYHEQGDHNLAVQAEAKPQRGRPRKGATPRRVVSLTLEPSVVAVLDAHCKATGKSRGDVVTAWVETLRPAR